MGFMSLSAVSQTAEELVTKNLQAKAAWTRSRQSSLFRMTGNFDAGGFKATVGELSKRPDMVRETFSLQGMTQVQAYDGSSGWQISVRRAVKTRKCWRDDVRGLAEDADFDGPLVKHRPRATKSSTWPRPGGWRRRLQTESHAEERRHLLLLPCPDTYIEIQIEKQQFIRGSVR